MTLNKKVAWLAKFCVLVMGLFVNQAYAEYIVVPKGEGKNCQRIVSISPALSDILLSLKLDDRVVGSTRYCQLPKDRNRQLVGGYFDLNFEKVVSLKPDIVFIEGSVNNPISLKLKSLGIKHRVFSLDTLDDMEAAKQEIGHYCEGEMVIGGNTLRDDLFAFVPESQQQVEQPPRVLILYNYGDNAAKVLPRLAAGRSFHGELLEALSMENVYLGPLNAPELTRESISLLNPEWIFIFNSMAGNNLLEPGSLVVDQITPKWEFLTMIDAVRKNQVYEIKGFYTQIPSVAAMRHLGKVIGETVYDEG
ncbi:ABC transporter substrate-binding protein [Ignatzschineria sp. LJL83]